MKIVILAINYPPESTSIGPYTADLAEHLLQRGHAVSVVTGFPIAPQWRVWDDYRGRTAMIENINGVRVRRLLFYVPSNPRKAFQRLLFDTIAGLSSLWSGLAAGPAALVIVISPPLQLGLSGWLLALIKGAPFYFHVQDMVPDAAVSTGLIGASNPAVQAARLLERFIYRHAKAVGVISEGFVRNLRAKGVPHDKIALLPNYIDLKFIHPSPRVNSFRRRYAVSADDLLVMYSGSVAFKQGLHTFVEAAAGFNAEKRVKFYLIGEGPYLPELKTLAEREKINNLHFMPLQPRKNLAEQLSAADILVITQRRTVTDVVFPGKLLYYMASARPILAAVNPNSDTGRFINKYQVGLVTPPEDPQSMVEAVHFLQRNPAEAQRLGTNARKAAEDMFDKNVVLDRFASFLESLV